MLLKNCRYYLEPLSAPKVKKPSTKKEPEVDWFKARQETAAKKKQAAEEKKRQAAEEKKQQLAAAAQARQQAAEEKRAEALSKAEAKRKEAEEKRAEAEAKRKAELKKKQVEKAMGAAKPGATISLGFFNFGQKSEEGESSKTLSDQSTTATPKKVSSAPRGVPTLSKWRQNRDGSITGLISGSKAYGEGETITTSAITSNAADGIVVQTKSGSRLVICGYFY